MIETAFFNSAEVHLQLLHIGGFFPVLDGLDLEVVIAAEYGHLFIVEVNHIFGVFDQGGGIGGQEKFVFANADHQGRTLAGSIHGIGVIA